MSRPKKRLGLKITAGILAVGIAAFLLYPTVIFAFEGKLKSSEVAFARSPDGRFALSITKRAAIPVNELFDPAIVVTARLVATDGQTVRQLSVQLAEDSDLDTLTLNWQTNQVRIVGFDRRTKQQLELPLNF